MGEADEAAQTRARLLSFHRNNNSMGRFYEMYPDEQPKSGPKEALRKLARELAPKEQTAARQQERAQQR